jgi:hypothetical protein
MCLERLRKSAKTYITIGGRWIEIRARDLPTWSWRTKALLSIFSMHLLNRILIRSKSPLVEGWKKEKINTVTYRPIARQRLGKTHSRCNEYAGNNRIISVAIQNGVVNTTVEEVMFSMVPPRNYISSTEQNQIRIRMERVLGSQGRRVRLKIYCQLS